MRVRRADNSDTLLLARLNRQLIRDEGHRNPMSVSELEARMEGWLEQYEAHIFSVEEQTIGYVLTRREEEHVYIRHFLIMPAFRRQGFGGSAFQWMVDHVWADVARLRLDVLLGNEPGIAFWRAMGFRDYCITMERE